MLQMTHFCATTILTMHHAIFTAYIRLPTGMP